MQTPIVGVAPESHALKNSGLVMVNASNYNRWQFDIFRPHLRGEILEIGCGLGNITQYLVPVAQTLYSVDIKEEAVTYTKKRFANFPNVQIMHKDVFAPGYSAPAPYDSILFCNVLEHIQDDLGAMRRCREMIAPGGTMVLLVPAHQWLYGTCDAEAGHFKRYSRKDIRQLARQSGFSVERLFAFNMVGALGWWVNYCLLKRRHTNNEESDTQVGLFDKYLVAPSRIIESIIPAPFGISYISILKAI